MLFRSVLFVVGGLVATSSAQYALQDDYMTNSFFNNFNFFTGDDPTHGYVNYVDQNTASTKRYIDNRGGGAYMGVDFTNQASGRGRDSVRLSSKKAYTRALIILDLAHMPGGQCGSWPAFWTFGPNWPNSGEIDIIEGVNSASSNGMALHTKAGCSVNANSGNFSGQMTTSNCDVNAPGQYANVGCGIAANNGGSYGRTFSNNGGGVYATEWTSDAISIWFFPRGSIPGDITSGSPKPATWGKPSGKFEGACVIDNNFANHNIIFDITFCGDWAGNVWGQDAACASRAPNCAAFVQSNPQEYTDAFWQINSLKVYQKSTVSSTSSSTTSTSSRTSTSSTTSTSSRSSTSSTRTSTSTSSTRTSTSTSSSTSSTRTSSSSSTLSTSSTRTTSTTSTTSVSSTRTSTTSTTSTRSSSSSSSTSTRSPLPTRGGGRNRGTRSLPTAALRRDPHAGHLALHRRRGHA